MDIPFPFPNITDVYTCLKSDYTLDMKGKFQKVGEKKVSVHL